MARTRQPQHDQARRLAVALASFVRAQDGLPLDAVAVSGECLSHASQLLALLGKGKPTQHLRSPAGRRPVHDRAWAHSCLIDIALADPDGMPSQAKLLRALEQRFEAASRTVPGETWLKTVVRDFQTEAREFEFDAVAAYQASTALQHVFPNATEFLRFRRAKVMAARTWAEKPEARAQFASPEKLLESAFHNGFKRAPEDRISAHSRLPGCRYLRSNR